MLSSTLTTEMIETELHASRLCCPDCDGPLAPWGWARPRTIRQLNGSSTIRPRRAHCHACAHTHVILPACSVPRRRDSAEVIGVALLAHANGDGHRTIAARLDRPPGTVRGWLRTFRRRAGPLTASAQRWMHAIAGPRPVSLPHRQSPAWTAVNAIGQATRVAKLQLGIAASPWEVAVVLTGGLLHGTTRQPTGL
jgi:transposase-like protein